jgi:hypothetical protein
MPGVPVSAAVTSAFVTRPRPDEFIPVLASSPASTTVTKSGPSSCLASSTTTVSLVCGSQSQFWPIRVEPPRPGGGTTANEVQPSWACRWAAAWRALAANITSVRTLMASTSPGSRPAPSAIPLILSR